MSNIQDLESFSALFYPTYFPPFPSGAIDRTSDFFSFLACFTFLHTHSSFLTFFFCFFVVFHSCGSNALVFKKILLHEFHISYSIDFSINGMSTANHLRPQWTPTPYKIKVNNCKLIDLVVLILMLRLSNFLRNSTIHFCTFLYLVTCFPRVTVSLLCRLQAGSRYLFKFIPI